jgi:hypothetical protein
MCTKEVYRADMCTRLCMAMHMYRQTKSISMQTHIHKTNLPITPNKRHARYFIDETQFLCGAFSIASRRLKLLCTKKSKSCTEFRSIITILTNRIYRDQALRYLQIFCCPEIAFDVFSRGRTTFSITETFEGRFLSRTFTIRSGI